MANFQAPQASGGSLAYGRRDLDAVVNIASYTVFSPAFTLLLSELYRGVKGASRNDPIVHALLAWFFLLLTTKFSRFLANKWRNRGTPGRLNWENQVVVITGGSSGVGWMLANTIATRNCTIAVLDVEPIHTEHKNIYYYKCDVSDWKQVEQAAKKIREEYGNPTILVNDAAVIQGKLIVNLTDEDVKQTFNVNIIAQFNTLRAFLPSFISAKGGHIVTMSSLLGRAACTQIADYNVYKAALILLHETLRQELDYHYDAPRVRTTIVYPGLILTPMMSGQRPMSEAALIPRWLFDFMLPSLPPEAVAREIAKALDTQESRDIMIPAGVKGSLLIPIIPYWMNYMSKWITGINCSMGFRKTTGIREGEMDAKTKGN